MKPPEVVVASAQTKSVVDYEDFTGNLDAFKKIDITSRVTGYLDKVSFKEGGPVKKGDVLFEIDSRPTKAELDKAEAEVVQAQARQQRLHGDLLRAQDLFRTRSISKEEYEKVSGDFEEAKAAVGVASATRKSAQLNYDYTRVLSPIDGQAGRTMLHEGNLIKADSTMLTVVVTKDPIYAYFDIDERTILKLRRLVHDEGATKSAERVHVTMALADEDGFPHEGKVDFEDHTIDHATGTLRLRGIFNNKSGFLAPGMFVRIRLRIGSERPAVVVPEEGVGADQGQKFVYVVTPSDEVEYRKIKTGPQVKNGPQDKVWRVVEEGLKVDERIVVSGLQRIRPMMKVSPREEPLPAAKVVRETPVSVR